MNRRLGWTLLAVWLACAASARAQDQAPAPKTRGTTNACREDLAKLCPDAKDHKAVSACLDKNEKVLSDACRDAHEKMEKRWRGHRRGAATPPATTTPPARP